MNVPNILSLIRVVLVPAFVAALVFMRDIGNGETFMWWGIIVPAIIYGLTAITDMLDGKIARKYNLVTDFGKFIDPLADKFMVISSQIAILLWMVLRAGNEFQHILLPIIFVWVVLIILLRELGVTSLRLVVAGKSGIVVAASFLGKMKTVSQMVGTVVIIVEPIFSYFDNSVCSFLWNSHILAYVAMGIMAFTTIFSGLDYLKTYLPHIDSNK